MIPKIIHQTGPTNKDDWHPLWFKCQESWIKNFPDYEYKFWNDEEIDQLVQEKYPEYWEMYQEFPAHIMKIDFVRFCFLDTFGGIYADLDFFCYKNFSDQLSDKVYLVENPYGNDPIENSLMCSEPNNFFLKKCLEKTKQRFEKVKTSYTEKFNNIKKISEEDKHGNTLRPYLIFYISGTNLLSAVYRENKNLVSTLPGFYFNNLDYSYDDSFYTKHVHTGVWGKEDIEIFKKDHKKYTIRNIPFNEYNFYQDYSKGDYKKSYNMNFDKNDVESLPNLIFNYDYS